MLALSMFSLVQHICYRIVHLMPVLNFFPTTNIVVFIYRLYIYIYITQQKNKNKLYNIIIITIIIYN